MVLASTAALALASCGDFDFDFRDLGNGFDTSDALKDIATRPKPDDRGIISYPTYQVVVARQGDTVNTIAQRLGVDGTALARYNGVDPGASLRSNEIIALPGRVAEPSPATGAATTGPLDVASIATTALDRVDAAQPESADAPQTTTLAAEPLRHRVARGETIFSIARLYDVPVKSLADWNGLGSELSVRSGQILLIPQTPASASAQPEPSDPGQGTATPVPPSAATPLPDVTPTVTAPTTPATAPAPTVTAPETPDIGTPTTPAASAKLATPVNGTIIRAYAPGRNEGIDIGAPAGTAVKAADAGTVAAVTTDTSGVPILVIKHADNMLTVYTNLDDLTVSKGDSVTRGQNIAKVRAGDPSFLHFEVRRGLQSVDPADFLP
jgi:murein DD-endopeptidase MepM/ murein hydrolase activator NlpD